MRCPGLHCPGCGDNGLAELLAALGVLVAIGAAIYFAVEWVVANIAWILGTLVVCVALAVYLALVVVPKLARRRTGRTRPDTRLSGPRGSPRNPSGRSPAPRRPRSSRAARCTST